LGSLSTVTKDSLIKHIMNTTSYYYDEYRNKYIGDGYIGSTGFIYHVSEGMKVWFPHSILSYDIVKTHNGEYLESKPMYNNKVGDYGFDLFNCNTTIFGSRICDINTRVSYQRKIDNNKYFYPNTKTNYYENRIEYKLLDNRLSDITLHFEGFTNPNDGIVKNKLTEYNNDSMVNEFFKDLDSLFGSSKILKTRFRDEVIRIWNYNNNRISVRYFNLNGRKQLSKISFTDWKYTTDFYQDIKKINPTVQVQLIFPSIYINEIK
jgi:hypothetical protein